MCSGQSTVKGQQVVVTGSGSIFVFVARYISVAPLTAGAPVGTTMQFLAVFNDNLSNTSPACLSSGWASSSPGVATINSATGLATAVSAGTTTISCTGL